MRVRVAESCERERFQPLQLRERERQRATRERGVERELHERENEGPREGKDKTPKGGGETMPCVLV